MNKRQEGSLDSKQTVTPGARKIQDTNYEAQRGGEDAGCLHALLYSQYCKKN